MMTDDELLQIVTSSVRKSFDQCRLIVEKDDCVGYSILADESANTFSIAVLSSEKFTELNGKAKEFSAYNPENWDVSEGLHHLSLAHEAIYKLEEVCEDYDHDDDWHGEYQTRVFQTLVRCLEQLKSENYFSNQGDEHTLLIPWIVDSKRIETRAKSWVKRLNSEKIYPGFVSWFDNYTENM